MPKKISLLSKKILGLEVGVLVFVFLLCYFFGNVQVGRDKEISIPDGANLEAIATTLVDKQVIRAKIGFKVIAYLTRRQNNLKTGDYRFVGQVSSYRVLDDIFAGKTIEEVFVLIEGWTVKQALREMVDAPFLTGSVTRMPAEGSLLPNSYNYRRGTKRQDLLDKMAKAMEASVDQAWAVHDPILDPYIKNKKEFVIFASIVERETGIKQEKARIAGVFLNRLQKRMRLETDPTVIYGLSNGLGELNRKLYIKDLKKPSPWNTYTNYGLPITAISNPSRETLFAVAKPERNSYLYFVANGRGGHDFSTNFLDHAKNIEKYISNKN
ncbi:MAG: endolytic transglycosylase MltG [Hydrotalea sp.]|nr:endolytic transglycosylase MltG [Hydrotalea sp.]